MRSSLLRLGALGAAVALAGAPLALRAQNQTLEIPTIMPVTGPAANLGQSMVETLHAVEKRVNATGGVRGRPIHFDVVDNQSNPQVEVQLTNAILAKKPNLVIDGGPATACKASAPLYARGPVMWCISPAFYPERGSYRFSAGVDSRDGAQAMLTYMRRAGLKRIAILTGTDLAGQEADYNLRQLLGNPANRELQLVAAERFAPADVSVSAQLAKLRAADPQVLIAWITGAPIATVFTGLRDTGWSLPVFSSNAVQSYPLMTQFDKIIPKEYYTYSLFWPGVDRLPNGKLKGAIHDYLDGMQAVNGHTDGTTAIAWDTTMLAMQTLNKLGADASPDAIRDYVAGLHGVVGASGTFDFRRGNQRGLGLENCIIAKWNAGAKSWDAVSGPAGTNIAQLSKER